MANAWHVTWKNRSCARSRAVNVFGTARRYRRTDGPTPPPPRRRCVLPRHRGRKPRRIRLPRRRRPPVLSASPSSRRAPLRLASPCVLPSGHALPPHPRDTGAEPLRRYARPQRRLRAWLQPALGALPPRLRPPLLREADRDRGALRQRPRVRPPEPRQGRPRPPCPRLAVDRGPGRPSDTFAPCRTTPTS